MIPEISHRCASCGAAIRDGEALFCPECGQPQSESGAGEAAANQETRAQKKVVSEADGDPVAETDEHPAAELHESQDAVVAPPSANQTTASAHPHRIADKTRETLHRASAVASAAARGVIEEPAKRVEKIRHASTHVIEEASYDPSLRFVLVALGLFVVFVILLVLSKVMG